MSETERAKTASQNDLLVTEAEKAHDEATVAYYIKLVDQKDAEIAALKERNEKLLDFARRICGEARFLFEELEGPPSE